MEDFSFLSENTFPGDSVPPLSFDFNSCDQFLSGLEASQGFYSTSTSSGSSPESHQLDGTNSNNNNNNNKNSRHGDNGVTLLSNSYPSLSPEMLLNNNNNKPSPDNYNNADGFPQVNQDDYLFSLVSPSSMSGAEAGSCEYSSDTHTSYTPDLKVEDSFSPTENNRANNFIPSKIPDNTTMMAAAAKQQPPPQSLAISSNYNRTTDSYNRPPVVNPQLQSPHSSYASELSSKDASPISNQDDDDQLPQQIGSSTSKSLSKNNNNNNPLGVKDGKVSKPKKSPHNMVEKRYRTNINDKISALRDHVPSLRAALNQSKGAINSEDLEGLSPANKLNKATILTKAMEYIEHLQKKNLMLTQENETLRQGRAFGNAGFQQQRTNNMDAIPQGSNRGGNNYVGKLMMGSMAGMMAFGTLSDFQQQSSSTKSMSAAPILLLNQALSSNPILPTMLFYTKILILFGALIYIFAPSVFESRNSKKLKFPSFQNSDSSTEIRHQAWLTSSQCLILPGSSTISKVRTITRNIVELVLQVLIGSEAKRHVLRLGRTDADLRKSALETATDAQLCGGDVDCSQWRLVSTLLASASEPLSPRRAMTLAMHVQVVLFKHSDLERVARKISNHYWNLARSMYKHALEVDDSDENKDMLLAPHLAALLECECDDVFVHDTVRKCHDLAWSSQKRKEANGKGSVTTYSGDFRLFDSALRLPLDALCDWHARGLLRNSLLQTLQGDVRIINKDALERVETAKKVAPPYSFSQRHAYIVRAVFSSRPDESKYLEEIFTLLQRDAEDNLLAPVSPLSMSDESDASEESDTTSIADSQTSNNDQTQQQLNDKEHRKLFSRISIKDEQSVSTSNFVTRNCFAGIRSAMIINACELNNLHDAGVAVDKLSINDPRDLELLGFVSVWRAVKILTKTSPILISSHQEKLEKVVGLLRVWIGGEQGDIEEIDVATRQKVSQECLDLVKRLGGIIGDDESDEGYATGGI